jgi:hypothetical protein
LESGYDLVLKSVESVGVARLVIFYELSDTDDVGDVMLLRTTEV